MIAGSSSNLIVFCASLNVGKSHRMPRVRVSMTSTIKYDEFSKYSEKSEYAEYAKFSEYSEYSAYSESSGCS